MPSSTNTIQLGDKLLKRIDPEDKYLARGGEIYFLPNNNTLPQFIEIGEVTDINTDSIQVKSANSGTSNASASNQLTQTGSIGISADIALTAGQKVKTITFTNNTTSIVFLQIHNKTSALTLGDIPLNGLILRIPANSTMNEGSGFFGDGILYGANTRIGLSSTFGTFTPITPANTSINIITVA